MIEAVTLVGFSMAFYIFNSLLLLLEVLHIFWSVMILNICITACKEGAVSFFLLFFWFLFGLCRPVVRRVLMMPFTLSVTRNVVHSPFFGIY